MIGIQILQNIQLRIALSWIMIRYSSMLFSYNIELLPLLFLTIAASFFVGKFLEETEETSTPIENTIFTPIDTRSPKIEDDILSNVQHTEIVISVEGVNMNL